MESPELPVEGGDLQVLAGDIFDAMSPAAEALGIGLAVDARSRSTLTGRDLQRWTYLLNTALDSFLQELPAGSAVRVELACVASTRRHRWLQADLVATAPEAACHPDAPATSRGGQPSVRWLLIETALRQLDGACDRTNTDAGQTLRLVAPVEG